MRITRFLFAALGIMTLPQLAFAQNNCVTYCPFGKPTRYGPTFSQYGGMSTTAKAIARCNYVTRCPVPCKTECDVLGRPDKRSPHIQGKRPTPDTRPAR